MDKLTEAAVREAHEPGLLWDHDPKVPGFGARVHAGGTKSFFLNYRLNGRQGRKTIGNWPTWSVEAARAEAKELRRRIDKGDDPARQTRERREAATIHDLIERYLDTHLPSKKAARQKSKIAM